MWGEALELLRRQCGEKAVLARAVPRRSRGWLPGYWRTAASLTRRRRSHCGLRGSGRGRRSERL